MEFLFELFLDLIIDSSINLSTNKKLPAIIRYLLIFFLCLFFLLIIGLVILLGISCLKNTLIGGIFVIIIGLILLILSIRKFKEIYLKRDNK